MKHLFLILYMAVLFIATKSWGSDSVVRGDKEWLQPASFTRYSYQEVVAVCPPPSGFCSGTLPGSTFDLSGYHWANEYEVRKLYESYAVGPGEPQEFFDDFIRMGDDIADDFLYVNLRQTPPAEGWLFSIVSADNEGIGDHGYDIGPYPADRPSEGIWFWKYAAPYRQKQFVFSIPESPPNPAQAECDAGVGFITKFQLYDINPNVTGKFKISSVVTWDKTGKVLDDDVNEIGEILVCQDWQTYWPQQNIVPVYFEITIGGRKYRAAGAGTSPDFPQLTIMPGGGQAMIREGYPEIGVTFLNYTATVLPTADGKVGGIFYLGNLAYVDGVDRDYYDHGSLGVLQILVPTDKSP